MAFLEGYAIGLSFILFLGPVFFTLLRSSLQHGFVSGFAVALGIFTSDVVCVFLLYGLGASELLTAPENRFYISLIGSLILIGLGLTYLIKPVIQTPAKLNLKAGHYLSFFAKGFIVNFINPFVFVVWMTIIGVAGSRYAAGDGLLWFLAGTLISILTTDTLKAVGAHRIKSLLNPIWLGWTYRGIGIVFLGFGIRLLMMALQDAPATLSFHAQLWQY
jgi:threonine/homoserine/homoserine lactone efflux protein